MRGDRLDGAKRPLTGRRIVLTRAPEQAGELTAALKRRGAEVLLMPTVEFRAPQDSTALDAAIDRMVEFDWIFFTSQNAVRFFAGRQKEMARGVPAKVAVAAVGPATAAAATREGFRVDYVANHHTGEGLVRELGARIGGRKVLLPRSDRDDRLGAALREAGAQLSEVVAYHTTTPRLDPEMVERIRNGEVDAIVFASPSAFHNLCDVLGPEPVAKLPARVRLAAIGPTTARALRKAGLRVEIEAADASAAALADAIADYYQRQSIARRA